MHGANSVPNLAGIDAATSAPRVGHAIPARRELGTPTTAAAPVSPVQPDNRVGVTRPDGVAGRLDEDCGVEHARTTDPALWSNHHQTAGFIRHINRL